VVAGSALSLSRERGTLSCRVTAGSEPPWTKSGSPDAWPVRFRKIESAARFVSRYHRLRIREIVRQPT
jgi:hypothetical protein